MQWTAGGIDKAEAAARDMEVSPPHPTNPQVPRSVSVSLSTIDDADLLLTAPIELRRRGFVGYMPDVHPSKQQDERLLHRPSTPRPQGQYQNGARRKMSRSVLMQPNVLAGPMATRSGIAPCTLLSLANTTRCRCSARAVCSWVRVGAVTAAGLA